MPKAEVGTPKYIANQMKAKGLQRLRWYCQVCEKQCRDENGFKCHTQSESHLQKILNVGSHAKGKIEEYSRQLKHDFIFLLRTGHGEKSINANRFYQEYIHSKDHIHMNATKWSSLSDFVKFLGREGICRVDDSEENGLCISWIDNSPEAIKRQEALKRKERADKGDEYRLLKDLEEQVKNANKLTKNTLDSEVDTELKRDSNSAPLSLKMSTSLSKPISLKPTSKPSTTKNVFSSSKVTKSKTTKPPSKPLNAFQKVMLQEQARLKR